MNLLFIFKQDSRSLKFNIKKYDELKKNKTVHYKYKWFHSQNADLVLKTDAAGWW